MKLLTSVLPPGTRILPAGWWFTLLVFSAVAGLEVVGRLYTSNDLHDALAAFLLLGVGIAARTHASGLRRCTGRRGWAASPPGFATTTESISVAHRRCPAA